MAKNHNFQNILDQQVVLPKQLLVDYSSYGIKEDELIVIMHIHRFRVDGNEFPTPEELSAHMNLTSQECAQILRKLIQKQLLIIEQKKNEANILNECYSLEPLWDKLFVQQKPQKEISSYEENIFPLFEQEFGRPLSPFEIETINIWLDEEDHTPALIKAALRESVLMSKLNFKYIDRILREWNKKGVKTVEQAREQGKQFRQGSHLRKVQPESSSRKRDVSLYYNWLEEDS